MISNGGIATKKVRTVNKNSANGSNSVHERAAKDCRSFDFFTKTADAKTRTITGVISSSVLDRDGEIILVEAVEAAWKDYMVNPVVLTTHLHRLDQGHSPVVGRMISGHRDGNQFVATVQFADTMLGEEYWQLYRTRIQRAFSVGFIGKESEVQLINGARVRVWKKIELLEVSCVPVPSNPTALSKSSAKKQAFVERKKLEAANDDYDSWDELCKDFGEAAVVDALGSKEEANRHAQEWIDRIFLGDKNGRLPGEKGCIIEQCCPLYNRFLDAYDPDAEPVDDVQRIKKEPEGECPDFASLVRGKVVKTGFANYF